MAQPHDKARQSIHRDELEAVSLTTEVMVLYLCGTTRWLNNATSTAIHIYGEQGQDGLHPEDQQTTRGLNNATSTAISIYIYIYAEQGQDGLHPEDQQAGRFPEGQHCGLEMENENMLEISMTWQSISRRPTWRPGDGD